MRQSYDAEEADALCACATAAEKAQDGDATSDGDDDSRDLVEGDERTGWKRSKDLEVEGRFAISPHPDAKADEGTTDQLTDATQQQDEITTVALKKIFKLEATIGLYCSLQNGRYIKL